jgi:hypothetical protein
MDWANPGSSHLLSATKIPIILFIGRLGDNLRKNTRRGRGLKIKNKEVLKVMCLRDPCEYKPP